jgi:tRNA(Arg) A34 adenosine deaminase TadA
MNLNIFSQIIDITKSLKDLPYGKNRHFSFITRGNKIISFGYNNSWKTHPIAKICNYRFDSIHSELAALLKFKLHYRGLDFLKKCSLVNTRINRFGDFCMSRPCVNCLKWISLIKFKDIYYTKGNGDFEKLEEDLNIYNGRLDITKLI